MTHKLGDIVHRAGYFYVQRDGAGYNLMIAKVPAMIPEFVRNYGDIPLGGHESALALAIKDCNVSAASQTVASAQPQTDFPSAIGEIVYRHGGYAVQRTVAGYDIMCVRPAGLLRIFSFREKDGQSLRAILQAAIQDCDLRASLNPVTPANRIGETVFRAGEHFVVRTENGYKLMAEGDGSGPISQYEPSDAGLDMAKRDCTVWDQDQRIREIVQEAVVAMEEEVDGKLAKIRETMSKARDGFRETVEEAIRETALDVIREILRDENSRVAAPMVNVQMDTRDLQRRLDELPGRIQALVAPEVRSGSMLPSVRGCVLVTIADWRMVRDILIEHRGGILPSINRDLASLFNRYPLPDEAAV